MKRTNEFKQVRHQIVYTIVAAVLLCGVYLSTFFYIYRDAAEDGFENLHLQTLQIKENINLQMLSDRENLATMANLAAELYSQGEELDLLVNTFETIGLIDNIEILMSDNSLITRDGVYKLGADVSFSEEAAKGEFISGRVKDFINPLTEEVRSAVPIVEAGKTIGVLYGIVDLGALEKKYIDSAEIQNAQLYVLERGNGNFIIDTFQGELGNITSLSTREYTKNYSYEQLESEILEGKSGFSSFRSLATGKFAFVHYAPLAISDWQIMLLKPESVVFEKARTIVYNLMATFAFVVLLILVYIFLISASQKKTSKINFAASQIRKMLLTINQEKDGIREALKSISMYAKSRSAFFVDMDGEDHNFIEPTVANRLLTGEDRKNFVFNLLRYAGRHQKGYSLIVETVKVVANKQLKKEDAEFYDFMKSHEIRSVFIVIIVNDKKDNVSVLGVINPRVSGGLIFLLKEIAVCFAMAIYNKKYLNKTELIAVTDPLTGLFNRMAYKKDVIAFDEKLLDEFSCIYIDVNELHVINNKHGHAAGDGMLLFIAKTLKEIFDDSRIYRIGGDEFLVFTEKASKEKIQESIDKLIKTVEEKEYHISVGLDFRNKNIDTEAMVKEAEKRMYEAKAEYYQQKERKSSISKINRTIKHMTTGIKELDATLSIMSTRYLGIYCVSLKTDAARRILMPEYLNYLSEENNSYSSAFSRYVSEMVKPDYQRGLLNFLKYDVIIRQLLNGNVPMMTYEKNDGDKITLSVYNLEEQNGREVTDTLWIFERNDLHS